MQNYTTTTSDKDEHTYDQIKMQTVVIPSWKLRITIAFLILILCLVSVQFGLTVHLSTLYGHKIDKARHEILKKITDVTRQDTVLKDQVITCDTGWKRFNDLCYYFNFDRKAWFDAERYCRAQNSFLAYIRDDAENGWIQSNMNVTDLWWVGATDWNTGTWIWSYDFSPLNYTKWRKGEPNAYNGTEENCCNRYYYGEWNDRNCTHELPFVCKDTERKISLKRTKE